MKGPRTIGQHDRDVTAHPRSRYGAYREGPCSHGSSRVDRATSSTAPRCPFPPARNRPLRSRSLRCRRCRWRAPRCRRGRISHSATSGSTARRCASGSTTRTVSSRRRPACTSPPPGAFIDVAVGDKTACGIRTNGAVQCWGDNTKHLAEPPEGVFVGRPRTAAIFRRCCGSRRRRPIGNGCVSSSPR